MNLNSKVLREDLESILNSKYVDFTDYNHSDFLITGSTGLIGSIIVRAFLLWNEEYGSNIHMILPVRNINKARDMFGISPFITYIESSVENLHLGNQDTVNYIIHAASPTKSRYFIERPVETINTILSGTENVLQIARDKKVKAMVHLSSMEMYGVLKSTNVTETDLGYINPLNTRSSYSEGKRMAELCCFSYADEYHVPVKIARIAMTFGAGLPKSENRVYKYFADCILRKEDIVLKSSGTTCVNYSYTTDTIAGLLCILQKGRSGEAYNVVGEKTGMTILESAEWLAQTYGEGRINVHVDIPEEETGYAPDNEMILSNEKLKGIGWKPQYTLKEGYGRLIQYLEETE